MSLVVYMCKDELKRENLSLSITLSHNPRCNISRLCNIPRATIDLEQWFSTWGSFAFCLGSRELLIKIFIISYFVF